MIKTLNLNGTWRARWTDGQRGRSEYANRDVVDESRYIDAIVPGEAHLDAWKAGLIADPYVGINCLSARWVEEMIWSYRREFDVPADALHSRAWLVFESLDLVATIVLNGQEVGRHNNVFYPCRIDVTSKLRPGKNVLAVHLDSGLYDVADKPWKGFERSLDERLTKRMWLRKPQCQFSWDWSTRLINVGIPKPVSLEWTEEPARVDQLVPLVEVSADLKKAKVRTRLFVEGLGKETARGELKVELPGLNKTAIATVDIKPGLHAVEAVIEVENPPLWWPVGHGPQTRFDLRATLSVAGRVIGEKSAKIGFRHVRVNQDPHPAAGRYFNFEINGRKIFCKGGNLVPADMIFARIDRRRYDRLTDLALESNYNFLRVWGGGHYESDDFFELCDEKGILVWQEFIFACDRFPTNDEAFHNSVKAEARYNIRRLAKYPCLVAWCGNNEIETANWHWGFDKGQVHVDYAMYHLTLPRLMAEEDPTRFYQPSSPYSPDHLDPNRDDVGDQHPWSIGFTNTDFRAYRQMICRFPNEGGILGPTSLPTMLACLPEGQRTTSSVAWQTHDNSIEGWAEPSPPDEMIRQWIGKDPRVMSIEDFTYWAGLVQSEGLRQYVDNFHRRMFDTGSAIFWMYNDCWPATRSWTTVDYFLRRTPAFHPVRRAMAPINVALAEEDGQIKIFGINETQTAVPVDLRYGIFNLAGGYPLEKSLKVELPANKSTVIASFEIGAWKNVESSMAFATLQQGKTLVARNRFYQPLFKQMKWPAADVRVKLADGHAVFECQAFAWNICIDLDGEQPLADNFFDVFPGQAYSIPWTQSQPPRMIRVGNLSQ